jgi:hypothetical protein
LRNHAWWLIATFGDTLSPLCDRRFRSVQLSEGSLGGSTEWSVDPAKEPSHEANFAVHPIVAGLALPGMAQARVTRGELRHDVHQVREQKRDLREELRERDRKGIREEKHELNRAKHELRQDTRRFHRQHHRG